MLASLRSRAALAATVFALAACGEETKLPTTLDTAEFTENVDLVEAAFENPQTQSLSELGFAIDNALIDFGGLPTSMASVVAPGPVGVPDTRGAQAMLDRVEELTGTAPVDAIPVELLGRTMVWNSASMSYQLSEPAIAGAPATGVRFRLYQISEITGAPAEPLVYVGYVDITREGTVNAPAARLAVFTPTGTRLLEYVATVGGTSAVPSFRVEGSAGVGPNAATFSLTVGVNLTNSTVTAAWLTTIPARGLTSRTTLGIGQSTFTINGVMQRGLQKVEIAGTLNFVTGGQLTVRVGNATFARMVVDAEGGTTVTAANGDPLTPEEEATLDAIFAWFASSLDWYDALLLPIYTVLDVPLSN